jgi:hypothetical protein
MAFIIGPIGGGNRNTLEKTTDMLQVTDKHNVVSSIPRHDRD